MRRQIPFHSGSSEQQIALAILAATFLLSTVAARTAEAQVLTILHKFNGADGESPQGGLVRDSSGNFYGTTTRGGTGSCPFGGCGTVFKLDLSGTLTVMHNFTASSDGEHPSGALILGSSGNLYGTARDGASSTCFSGCGTVFKVDPSATFTVLHSFSNTDGANPYEGLMPDSSGNFYGAAYNGGASNKGILFKLDPSGTLTVLYSFSGSDGANPNGDLIMDASGNLYGTTYNGGSLGYGTVFKLDRSGTLTVLHNFSFSGSDGAYPNTGLIMDSSGNLYGTTWAGGSSTPHFGTVFKIDASGKFATLHSFSGPDGSSLFAGVVLDSSGILYGTTYYGGLYGYGTVFAIDPSSTLTMLYSFSANDGAWPQGNLILDSAGSLYGTTGGDTVFKLYITPKTATQMIVNQVNALFAQARINSGQDNSMITELQQAMALIDKGKTAGAIQSLQQFIGEVQDLERSGVLPVIQAEPLISQAKGVIAKLS